MTTAGHLFSKIIKSSLFVATLDILAAFLYLFVKTGNENPVIMFKYIASGVFGMQAFTNDSMAIVGFALHYFIAFLFSTFFFLLYNKIRYLSKNRLVTGVFYGAFIWVIMYMIVVLCRRFRHSQSILLMPLLIW